MNNARNGNAKNNFVHRYRRPSLQSRLQDGLVKIRFNYTLNRLKLYRVILLCLPIAGKNLQLCFLNQQSSEVDDHQLEDGALSLPILQSKYLLNDRVRHWNNCLILVSFRNSFNLKFIFKFDRVLNFKKNQRMFICLQNSI